MPIPPPKPFAMDLARAEASSRVSQVEGSSALAGRQSRPKGTFVSFRASPPPRHSLRHATQRQALANASKALAISGAVIAARSSTVNARAAVGGFAGSMILPSMAWRLKEGYAVSGTDTGHTGGPLDAAWALGHPEKIADFGWRAIHETAEASKAVIAGYYDKPASHAYFAGCSDGGREALMAAQRFPKDFDGIVAGAPAVSRGVCPA